MFLSFLRFENFYFTSIKKLETLFKITIKHSYALKVESIL